jgi:DNA-binding Lrp family transcriptional regulator
MHYAFVNVSVTAESPVDALAEISGVESVHEVRGTYRAVVELALEDPDDLQAVVTGAIQKAPGVTDTDTLVSPSLAKLHRPTEGPVTGPFVEEGR